MKKDLTIRTHSPNSSQIMNLSFLKHRIDLKVDLITITTTLLMIWKSKRLKKCGFWVLISRLLIKEEMKKWSKLLKNGVMLELELKSNAKENKNIRTVQLSLNLGHFEDLTGKQKILIPNLTHYSTQPHHLLMRKMRLILPVLKEMLKLWIITMMQLL